MRRGDCRHPRDRGRQCRRHALQCDRRHRQSDGPADRRAGLPDRRKRARRRAPHPDRAVVHAEQGPGHRIGADRHKAPRHHRRRWAELRRCRCHRLSRGIRIGPHLPGGPLGQGLEHGDLDRGHPAALGPGGGRHRQIRRRARLLAFALEPADRRDHRHRPTDRLRFGRCRCPRQYPQRERGDDDRAARRLPALGQPHAFGRSEMGLPQAPPRGRHDQ